MNKAPFTAQERRAWDLLSQIYQIFSGLEQTHPSHMKDLTDAIHVIQNILGHRVCQRAFGADFALYKNGKLVTPTDDFIETVCGTSNKPSAPPRLISDQEKKWLLDAVRLEDAAGGPPLGGAMSARRPNVSQIKQTAIANKTRIRVSKKK